MEKKKKNSEFVDIVNVKIPSLNFFSFLFNLDFLIISSSLALNVPDAFMTSVWIQIVVEDIGSHRVCVCVKNEERVCVTVTD